MVSDIYTPWSCLSVGLLVSEDIGLVSQICHGMSHAMTLGKPCFVTESSNVNLHGHFSYSLQVYLSSSFIGMFKLIFY